MIRSHTGTANRHNDLVTTKEPRLPWWVETGIAGRADDREFLVFLQTTQEP